MLVSFRSEAFAHFSARFYKTEMSDSSPFALEGKVTVDRTELEWRYEPTDFFEAPYRHGERDFELKIESGTAVANLGVTTEPPPSDLDARVRALVKSLFLVRQLQLHKNYKLEGPKIVRYSSGIKNVTLEVGSAVLALTGGRVDFTIHDAAGNLVRDSKAERIAQDTSLLDVLAPKLQHSSTLQSLFDSYSRSVADPADEFTHLYEIRDALSTYLGGKPRTLRALGISESDWSRFGFLTNAERLEQSRHRGNHPIGRRQATDEELNEARTLARQWIIAFARKV